MVSVSILRWFFGVLILTIIMAIFLTRVFFGASLLHPYRIVQFSLLVLAIVAATSDRDKTHQIISVLFFALMAVGISIFRFLPELFTSAAEY